MDVVGHNDEGAQFVRLAITIVQRFNNDPGNVRILQATISHCLIEPMLDSLHLLVNEGLPIYSRNRCSLLL